MFNLHRKADLLENQRLSCSLDDLKAKLMAVSRSMAIIEFSPEGIILDANDNFCRVMGYSADEIRGKHHRLFCEDAYQRGIEYAQFWKSLANGVPLSGTFLRLDKAGREIWLEASYMPITDANRQVTSVIKVAADITDRINKEHENQSIVNALSRSMAMIEFSPDGRVIHANQNFLDTLHYSLAEIVGQHHSMFAGAVSLNQPSTKPFGPPSIVVYTIPDALSGSINMAIRYSLKPPTTRYSTPRGVCTKW